MQRRSLGTKVVTGLVILGCAALVILAVRSFIPTFTSPSPGSNPTTASGPRACPPAQRAADGTCKSTPATPTATPATPQAPTPAPAATKVRVLSRACNEVVLFDFTEVGQRVVNDHGCVLQCFITGKVKVKVEYCTDTGGKKVRCTAWDDKTKTVQWWEVIPSQEAYLSGIHVLEFAYSGERGGVTIRASPFK